MNKLTNFNILLTIAAISTISCSKTSGNSEKSNIEDKIISSNITESIEDKFKIDYDNLLRFDLATETIELTNTELNEFTKKIEQSYAVQRHILTKIFVDLENELIKNTDELDNATVEKNRKLYDKYKADFDEKINKLYELEQKEIKNLKDHVIIKEGIPPTQFADSLKSIWKYNALHQGEETSEIFFTVDLSTLNPGADQKINFSMHIDENDDDFDDEENIYNVLDCEIEGTAVIGKENTFGAFIINKISAKNFDTEWYKDQAEAEQHCKTLFFADEKSAFAFNNKDPNTLTFFKTTLNPDNTETRIEHYLNLHK